jgi:hypothetical protein
VPPSRPRATATENSNPFVPRAGQCSIKARHFSETLNHTARRNHGQSRATQSGATNKSGQDAEASCVDVIHAGQIEHDISGNGLIEMRRPQRFVCTVAQN